MLLLILAICIFVSIVDCLYRKINNYSVVAILAVELLFYDIHGLNYKSSFTVLIFGLCLFTVRLIAAGDIKYATVLALLIPFSSLSDAVFLTALSGGIVALVYLTVFLCKKRLDKDTRNYGIPYSVAISIGFYLTILANSSA